MTERAKAYCDAVENVASLVRDGEDELVEVELRHTELMFRALTQDERMELM